MTVTDDDIYKHLEHFGVKGQKWGVRNKRNVSKVEETTAEPEGKKFKELSRGEKTKVIGTVAGVTAILAAGAIGTAIFMNHRDKMKISKIPNDKVALEQYNKAKELIFANHTRKYKELTGLTDAGKITTLQRDRIRGINLGQERNALNKAYYKYMKEGGRHVNR